MPASKNGLKLLDNASAAAGGLTPKRIYTYVTNDTMAQIEADSYFDGILSNGLGANDVILALIDVDGTPLMKLYMVTAGGADVAIRGLGASILALTDSSGGTPGATLPAISGTYVQAEIRNSIASLAAQIEKVRQAITV